MPMDDQNKSQKIKEQKHMKTASFNNDFTIKRGSISLEQDSLISSKYYIAFEYQTFCSVELSVYFDCLINFAECNIDSKLNGGPITLDKNHDLNNRKSTVFFKMMNQDISIDLTKYFEVKTYSMERVDVLIKISYRSAEMKICHMFMLFKMGASKGGNSKPILKFIGQKMMIDGDLFDLHDVYGLGTTTQGEE